MSSQNKHTTIPAVKQRPILFSTEMVQAKLAGRKSMTRRTTGLGYINSLGDKITFGMAANGEDMTHTPSDPPGRHAYFGNQETDDWYQPIFCPYGQIGDILWVRETWHATPVPGLFNYKASQSESEEADRKELLKHKQRWAKWKPSIHMPKKAARLYLRISDITVERLQDISFADAIEEGIESWEVDHQGGMVTVYKDYIGSDQASSKWYFDPIKSFQSLWESINGADSWKANPWVWVLSFERIEKPE